MVCKTFLLHSIYSLIDNAGNFHSPLHAMVLRFQCHGLEVKIGLRKLSDVQALEKYRLTTTLQLFKQESDLHSQKKSWNFCD